jgi:3-methyladenine DNA glycosylase AlkD
MSALRATQVIARLKSMGSPAKAAHSLRFFRTGPGEYGEGDRFLGLTVPEIRAIERQSRDLPLTEVDRLLQSEWHEARLLALLILVHRYTKGDTSTRQKVYRLYLDRTDRINNWDLVDSSAPGIVGAHLRDRADRAKVLDRLARSRSLWERRIAIVATLHFIRAGELADTMRIAAQLLDDDEDLIHKAAGWMLREAGKKDVGALRAFLDRFAPAMPRTMLRYAIERLPEEERRRYRARTN